MQETGCGESKTSIGPGGAVVGDDDFVEQADGQEGDADVDVGGNPFSCAGLGELRHEFGMVNDRPGDQVREEGDEQNVAEKSEFRCFASVCVNQKRDLRECEKGNAERQRDLQRMEMIAGNAGPIHQGEIGVFEEGESGEVGGDAQREDAFFEFGLIGAECQAECEIGQDADGDDEEVPWIPPGVEEERHGGQDDIGKPAGDLRGREIEEETERQEDEEKLEAVIEHVLRGKDARFRCLGR